MREIDHEYTEETVCPWCGHEYGDSWEEDEDGEMECDNCRKEFSYWRNVQVTYSTKRKECSEHNYVLRTNGSENPYIYKDKNWTLYICTVCQDEVIKTGPIIDNKPYVIVLELASPERKV